MKRVALPRRLSHRYQRIRRDGDRPLATRALARTLPAALGAICLFQMAAWLPHYLTWPWWADHDVFATMALGWDRGVLPYRDLAGNNFPGTIYLFWILGRLTGWGWGPALAAVDCGMLLVLGGALLLWSRRRFGGLLPGLIGYASFSSYYFSLDYTVVAQRDWHGPFFAVTALLVADTFTGRIGRGVSALGLAIGFVIRPQVVLLVPAFGLALRDGARRSGKPEGPRRVLAEWGLMAALGLVLVFLPIVGAGIASDFARSIGLVVYGGHYNRVGPVTVLVRMVRQFLPFATWCVPAAIALLAARSDEPLRRLSWIWLAAFLGVAFHKPISPIWVPYLDLPLRLVWSLNLAVASALVLDARALVPTTRLVLVLCFVSLGVTTEPRFCDVSRSIAAVKALYRRGEPVEQPIGYTHDYLRKPYRWKDYRQALAYLRTATSPETRVANALKNNPAITGAIGRLPVFPAESLAWIRMVKPDDEASFTRALELCSGSVVVWAPSESEDGQSPRMPAMFAAIRRLYEPEAKFGTIEIWRRKPEHGGPKGRPRRHLEGGEKTRKSTWAPTPAASATSRLALRL